MTRAASIALLLLIGSLASLRAQSLTTPFYASEGLAAAEARARAALAGDAQLIFMGTLGDFTIPAGGAIPIDLELHFYLDSARGPGPRPSRLPGQADAWVYLFRSADVDSTLPLIVVKLFGTYQVQAFEGFPFPPLFGSDALEVDAPYSESGAMTLRLAVSDSVYRRYHSGLPESRPDVVTYGQLLPVDSVRIPIDFLNGPAWTMTFTGGSDTSMTCFVSARTGSTFCRWLSLPSSVTHSPRVDSLPITLVPNPSRDHVSVIIRPPIAAGAQPVEVAVIDARGDRVMKFVLHGSTPSLVTELSTRDLPSGLYFILVTGNDWRRTAGLVVGEM